MFINKKNLYSLVNELRIYFEVSSAGYPLDVVSICKNCPEIAIKDSPFDTPGLRGLAFIRNDSCDKHIIMLNSKRNKNEKNFDCAHELMHVSLHSNANTRSFCCYEKIAPGQNKFLEWQANEGAAEFIMPYQMFIPDVITKVKKIRKQGVKEEDCLDKLSKSLARTYNVTEHMAKIRLSSLSYELLQYAESVPLQEICILSHEKQKKAGLFIPIEAVIARIYHDLEVLFGKTFPPKRYDLELFAAEDTSEYN